MKRKVKVFNVAGINIRKPANACEWFLKCKEPAVEMVPHPVLGEVPATLLMPAMNVPAWMVRPPV